MACKQGQNNWQAIEAGELSPGDRLHVFAKALAPDSGFVRIEAVVSSTNSFIVSQEVLELEVEEASQAVLLAGSSCASDDPVIVAVFAALASPELHYTVMNGFLHVQPIVEDSRKCKSDPTHTACSNLRLDWDPCLQREELCGTKRVTSSPAEGNGIGCHGHPHECTPCERFHRHGVCQYGESCAFCHSPHVDAIRNGSRKRQREAQKAGRVPDTNT